MHGHISSKRKKTNTVGVFEPPTSKFIFACLARIVCSEDTRIYTGSGGTSLHPVYCCSCYRHLVYSRDYKQAREAKDPKSWWKEWTGAESSIAAQPCACVFVISWFGLAWIGWYDSFFGPLHEIPCFLFYRQRKNKGYNGGKRKERERGSPSGSPGPSHPSRGSRATL